MLYEVITNSTFEGIDNYISFFYPVTVGIQDYMDSPLVILDEPSRLRERNMALLDEFSVMYEEAASSNTAVKKQSELMLGIDEIFYAAMKSRMLTIQNIVTDESIHVKKIIRFDGSEAPVYRGKFNLLKNDLARWSKMHYNVVFLTGSDSRAKRLRITSYNVCYTKLLRYSAYADH